MFHINWLQNALALYGTNQPALVTVLGSDLRLLKTPGMAPLLRRVFSQRRTILAPNSNWMETALQQHFSEVAEIRPIPFGIDSKWFELKRNWPNTEKSRWLVVLRLTKKKIGPLFEWGKDFFTGSNELHLFGPMQETLTIPDWAHYHGPSNPAELLPWFTDAAGMITLSQHDEGRPQVLLEAMAAGLPIIASSLPAHSDLITDGETGILCDTHDGFLKALRALSEPGSNLQLGQQAKHWVREHIGTWEDCAQRYMAAYRHLL
jgi:glycosyltransferase involved in cell wall biosynthesis